MIEIIRDRAKRDERIEHIGARSAALSADLLRKVSAIIEDVRSRGDEALIEYTEKFDGVRLEPENLRVDEETLHSSAERVDVHVIEALRESIRRVREFHEHEIEKSWEVDGERDVRMGQRITPIERAGLYVPGGTASYPSSVVMNVVPARVAGVERIVITTPPRTLGETPAVAAALLELKVTEIYQVGGAQAIAALAFGTETIPRVDKITGPGNRYVAAAKKLVFGAVGIDSIAGPSEVVIIADAIARSEFIAADLLAQAEHGEDASAILVTTSDQLANDVVTQLSCQAKSLPRQGIVEKSLARHGVIFVVADLDEACTLVNELAPEHLQIVTRDNDSVTAGILYAGAIFFGPYTPEVLGAYFPGPHHELPAARTARIPPAPGA